MSPSIRRMMPTGNPSKRNRRVLLYHLLVHLHLRASSYTQPSVAQGCSKPRACAKHGRNHYGICHIGFVDRFKCGATRHFIRDCPRSKKGSGNGEIELRRHQLLHQKILHLGELLLVWADKQTACMLSIIADKKMIHMMLSLICFDSLTLLFMHYQTRLRVYFL